MKNGKFYYLLKIFFLQLLFMGLSVHLWAQETTITGTVTDENGATLPGANVQVAGTSKGTVTNLEGEFEITVSDPNATLNFSYVGYLTEKIELDGQTSLEVTLVPDLQQLEQVVVVGYGTMKRSDLTGAVASVSSEDIQQTKSSNAIEALQGKIAGVDMTRSSGRAGSGYNILVRGQRSFSASNAPLYIVDGVEYGSDININPNDIESMEVLKDASSTAIYGSRGANGVILITTKKGSEGRPTVAFNTYYGVTSPLGELPMQDAQGYLQHTYDRIRIDDEDLWGVPNSEIDVTQQLSGDEIEGYENGTDFDWIDAQMKENGTQQDYHLSVTGGNEQTNYSLSLNHFLEENFIYNDEYKRYSIKGDVNTKIRDFLEIGNSTYLSQVNRTEGNGLNYNQIPLVSAYDSVGDLIPVPNPGRVPFSNILIDQDPENFLHEFYTTDVFSTFYGQLNLMPGLTFRSSINFDLRFQREGEFLGDFRGLDRQSTAYLRQQNFYEYTWQNILTYDKTFGSHHILLTGATETNQEIIERSYMEGQDLQLSDFWWYGLRTSDLSQVSLSDPRAGVDGYPYVRSNLVSFIGRIHYGFQGKYLATVTGRYDGASQLVNKWDFFPSASVAWRLSEEDFLKNSAVLSNLKLRVSYGVTGNQSVSPYSSLGGTTPYTIYYNFGTGDEGFSGRRTFAVPTFPKWETTSQVNVGLDFGFLQNRFSGSLDYYQSQTTDILQEVILPPTSAVRDVVQNIGETEGQGIELLLRGNIVSTSDWTWDVSLTFTRQTEEITFLAGGVEQDVVNGWFVGSPLQVHYDWRQTGIWQQDEAEQADLYGREPGQIKLDDINGDTAITSEDRVVLGTPRPDWTGGLNSTLRYKDFDLSVFVFARQGHMVADNADLQWSPDGRENSIERDYWTPSNPTNKYPRVDPGLTRSGWAEATTLMYKDGSFVKIKDITLGYTLPENLISNVLMSRARIYVSAKNYFAFGEFFDQGRYDPEAVSSSGRFNISLPIPKMLVFGANINF